MVAAERGYDLSVIRSQKVSTNDFFNYDIFLAMDNSHLKALQRLKPINSQSSILLFLEYSQEFARQDVPDPYYGSEAGFSTVLKMIEEGADTFLDQMYPLTKLKMTK